MGKTTRNLLISCAVIVGVLFGVFNLAGYLKQLEAVWDRVDGAEQNKIIADNYTFFKEAEEAGHNRDNTADNPKTKEHKEVLTTLFWVGEQASRENGYISNSQSMWDSDWQASYGGVDDPEDRCGFKPCSFEPEENPFYFALPYSDFDENGEFKNSAREIPWYQGRQGSTILKNRWIEIMYGQNICYAQWEDVGPFLTDDFEYVFGDAEPKNNLGVAAGLDISPAVWDCLGLTTNDYAKWRFIAEADVPEGPWKEIITR